MSEATEGEEPSEYDGLDIGGSSPDIDTTDWCDLLDEDRAAFAKAKGWDSPEAVVESYRQLERLLGHDRAGRTVVLPKDESDTDALNALYDRLGRPAEPGGYELDLKTEAPADEALVDWFRSTAHAVGLSTRQAAAMAEAWETMIAARAQDQAQAREAKDRAALEALKAEWGVGFDRKLAVARQAARQFAGADLDTFLRASNIETALPLFARIGEAIQEDGFPAGDTDGRFGLTPSEARAAYERRKHDRTFVDALSDAGHPGHAAASAERSRYLNAIWPME